MLRSWALLYEYFSFFYPLHYLPFTCCACCALPLLFVDLCMTLTLGLSPRFPRIKDTSFSFDIGLSSYWYTSSPTLFVSLDVLYLLHDSTPHHLVIFALSMTRFPYLLFAHLIYDSTSRFLMILIYDSTSRPM